MKNHIRDMMLLTFLLLTSSMMWAKGQVSIIQTGQGNARILYYCRTYQGCQDH